MVSFDAFFRGQRTKRDSQKLSYAGDSHLLLQPSDELPIL